MVIAMVARNPAIHNPRAILVQHLFNNVETEWLHGELVVNSGELQDSAILTTRHAQMVADGGNSFCPLPEVRLEGCAICKLTRDSALSRAWARTVRDIVTYYSCPANRYALMCVALALGGVPSTSDNGMATASNRALVTWNNWQPYLRLASGVANANIVRNG